MITLHLMSMHCILLPNVRRYKTIQTLNELKYLKKWSAQVEIGVHIIVSILISMRDIYINNKYSVILIVTCAGSIEVLRCWAYLILLIEIFENIDYYPRIFVLGSFKNNRQMSSFISIKCRRNWQKSIFNGPLLDIANS